MKAGSVTERPRHMPSPPRNTRATAMGLSVGVPRCVCGFATRLRHDADSRQWAHQDSATEATECSQYIRRPGAESVDLFEGERLI